MTHRFVIFFLLSFIQLINNFRQQQFVVLSRSKRAQGSANLRHQVITDNYVIFTSTGRQLNNHVTWVDIVYLSRNDVIAATQRFEFNVHAVTSAR